MSKAKVLAAVVTHIKKNNDNYIVLTLDTEKATLEGCGDSSCSCSWRFHGHHERHTSMLMKASRAQMYFSKIKVIQGGKIMEKVRIKLSVLEDHVVSNEGPSGDIVYSIWCSECKIIVDIAILLFWAGLPPLRLIEYFESEGKKFEYFSCSLLVHSFVFWSFVCFFLPLTFYVIIISWTSKLPSLSASILQILPFCQIHSECVHLW